MKLRLSIEGPTASAATVADHLIDVAEAIRAGQSSDSYDTRAHDHIDYDLR